MGFWKSNKNLVPGRLVITATIPGTNKTKIYEGLLGEKEPISELFANEFSSGFETAPDSTWGWEENLETKNDSKNYDDKIEIETTPNIENLRLSPSPTNFKTLSETSSIKSSKSQTTTKEDSSPSNKSPLVTEGDSRLEKFKTLLNQDNVQLEVLRKISWKGIPKQYRAESWKLLLGYTSSNSERRKESLNRKRNEYFNVSKQLFDNGEDSLDNTIFQQISIDLPRTFPTITLFHQPAIRKIMEKVLYTWSIRHPASGYVQGINDIVVPFIYVFLLPYLPENQGPESFDVSLLSDEILGLIEADTFWCFSKLMDGIQDNYTFAQRGIQRQLTNLKALIERSDYELAAHLMEENVEFIQFAFRWMNCLLLREVNLDSSIRMWDTYLSEGFDNFSDFHLYVCAAFLKKFKSDLITKDFQDILLFLQSPPTKNWKDSDIELLLSEAYLLQSLFKNAPNLFG